MESPQKRVSATAYSERALVKVHSKEYKSRGETAVPFTLSNIVQIPRQSEVSSYPYIYISKWETPSNKPAKLSQSHSYSSLLFQFFLLHLPL